MAKPALPPREEEQDWTLEGRGGAVYVCVCGGVSPLPGLQLLKEADVSSLVAPYSPLSIEATAAAGSHNAPRDGDPRELNSLTWK